MYGGTSLTDSASISVYGNNEQYNTGKIILRTQDPEKAEHYLIMYRNGVLSHESNDLGAAAIVAKNFSGNGYIKYANGMTMQWGVYNYTAAVDATVSIKLPIIFPTLLFTVSAQPCTNENTIDYRAWFHPGYPSDDFSYLANINSKVMWLAIGY